jgi:hypothetical protein
VKRPPALATVLALALAAEGAAVAALLAGAGCDGGAPSIRYTGKSYPRIVADVEHVETYGGTDPPEGYFTIGVATGACTAVNGSGGLLAGPCNVPAMVEEVRRKAAEVGGSALVELRCKEDLTDRVLERRDGGGVETTLRTLVACVATVVRRKDGRPPVGPAPRAPARATAARVERLEIGGEPVEVAIAGGAVAAPVERVPDEVGEVASARGLSTIAELTAECQRGCARSVAWRALRTAAGKLGAPAIAEVDCGMIGERWRCRAKAVDERAGGAGGAEAHGADAG